jgi:hypothetical protein
MYSGNQDILAFASIPIWLGRPGADYRLIARKKMSRSDLGRFKSDSVHLKSAGQAKRSPRFRAIGAQLKTLPEEQRKAILAEACDAGHLTWAQLGRITTDGSGQTEAGQAAERLIAGAIVHMTEEMLIELDR